MALTAKRRWRYGERLPAEGEEQSMAGGGKGCSGRRPLNGKDAAATGEMCPAAALCRRLE
jgi:hypothetical protein